MPRPLTSSCKPFSSHVTPHSSTTPANSTVPSSLAVKRTARRSASAIAGSYAHLSVKLSHGTLPV